MSEEPILPSKEQLVITQILVDQEKDPDLTVTKFDLSHPCKNGDNYMSVIQRANVIATKSDGSEIERVFIIKIEDKDETKKETLSSEKIWLNEQQMYEEYFPTLNKICETDLYIPKHYYNDPEMIILEDLEDSGYKLLDRTRGFDLDQTLLVVNRLAHFHASSLALQFKDRNAFHLIKLYHKHPYLSPESRKNTSPFVNSHLMRAADVLLAEPNSKKYAKAISFFFSVAEHQSILIKFLQEVPSDEISVIIHGDFWINNILIKEDPETKKPIDAKFVDFQATRLGVSVIDLHHLLYTSVQTDVRQKNLDAILKHYYESQMKYLKEMMNGASSDYLDNYTLHHLTEDFKKYRLYGIMNAVLMLPVLTLDAKEETFNFLCTTVNSVPRGYKDKLVTIVEEYTEKDWLKIDYF